MQTAFKFSDAGKANQLLRATSWHKDVMLFLKSMHIPFVNTSKLKYYAYICSSQNIGRNIN